MHLTEIILLDGTRITGVVEQQRYDPDVFELSHIKLFTTRPYMILEMQSATTKGERVGIGRLSDVDEIALMRECWMEYKADRMKGLSLTTELKNGH